MKNIIVYLACIVAISGCIKQVVIEKTYTIYNETSKNVKIQLYRKGELISSDFVYANGIIIRKEIPQNSNIKSSADALKADSAIIIFDNNRTLTHTLREAIVNKKSRNIFNDASYTEVQSPGSSKGYRYILNNQDLMSAK